jgi:murein DD-endopeptidase MepM/ murein hydrolase activator NlpD
MASPRAKRAAVAIITASFCAWVGCFGPRDLWRYPPKIESPYRLPFEGERWVCQGNNGMFSHFRGRLEFAYDFYMPEGTAVLAARGGVIRATRDHLTEHGYQLPANFVSVDHGDGTLGWYLHLEKGGALVRPGERVEQGQRIARSGFTGNALLPHLHFEVTRDAPGARETVPVTFADAAGDGIPRAPWLAP